MALYIVATPIGNLEDITLRALETLKKVDIIACEDTRHSLILLKRYEIEKKLLSYHSHSGQAKLDKLIEAMHEGNEIALISDAGTPGISDPAYGLITAALEQGIEIIPIPGPCAFLAALVASGLPMNQFTYLGFLPIKKGRQTLLKLLKDEKKTIVFYESPHRIQKTLSQLEEFVGGERRLVIGRELTKLHEEFLRGTVTEVKKEFENRKPRGEFTVVLGGKGMV